MPEVDEAGGVAVPAQAVRVGGGIGAGRAGGGPRVGHGGEGGGLVKLAEGGAADRAGVGVVAGRVGREVKGGVAGEVGEGRDEAAHRAVGAVAQERLELPGVVFPAVAERELTGGHGGVVPDGVVHAEGREELAGDVNLVGLAGDAVDDGAEEGVAEVAVFVGGAGRTRKRKAAANKGFEGRRGDRELAVAPRVVLRQAGGHGEELQQRDRRGVGRGQRDGAELGEMLGERVGEGEAAGVAEAVDCEGGEAFRHRGDAEAGVGGDGRFLGDVREAERGGVDEATVEHDAVDEAGEVLLGGGGGEEAVDFGEDGGEAGVGGGGAGGDEREGDGEAGGEQRERSAEEHGEKGVAVAAGSKDERRGF